MTPDKKKEFMKETLAMPSSGYGMLIAVLALFGVGISLLLMRLFLPGILILLLAIVLLFGFIIVNPNEATVLILFGSYIGTVKHNGFFWVNPFLSKKEISLRAKNLNGPHLKVNDKVGNPIEIAAVIVWQVQETARASFEVDDYNNYIATQSEAALRHLASTLPYDNFNDDSELTLRGGADKVNKLLEAELSERLDRAGVTVIEARISHLAYAPEIAGAMLQRQQATAVVAARKQIVEGAVGMVEMALEKLSEKKVVELDEERKSAMVSNLLVVLCGERNVQPIVNTGTLYH
ncbi:MAG: SPFH domain-containing protein [Chloroherpetonaceae bacterium]|nr:SPFH domain-containing protein [Chloroherpetonaceae bacterium]